jgi:hypothetical protein
VVQAVALALVVQAVALALVVQAVALVQAEALVHPVLVEVLDQADRVVRLDQVARLALVEVLDQVVLLGQVVALVQADLLVQAEALVPVEALVHPVLVEVLDQVEALALVVLLDQVELLALLVMTESLGTKEYCMNMVALHLVPLQEYLRESFIVRALCILLIITFILIRTTMRLAQILRLGYFHGMIARRLVQKVTCH